MDANYMRTALATIGYGFILILAGLARYYLSKKISQGTSEEPEGAVSGAPLQHPMPRQDFAAIQSAFLWLNVSGLTLVLAGMIILLIAPPAPASAPPADHVTAAQIHDLANDVKDIKQTLLLTPLFRTSPKQNDTSSWQDWLVHLAKLVLALGIATGGIWCALKAFQNNASTLSERATKIAIGSIVSTGAILSISVQSMALLKIEWPTNSQKNYYNVRVDGVTIEQKIAEATPPDTPSRAEPDETVETENPSDPSLKQANAPQVYITTLAPTPLFADAQAELSGCDELGQLKQGIQKQLHDGYEPLFLLIIGKTDKNPLGHKAQQTYDSNSALGLRRAAWVKKCLLDDNSLTLKAAQLIALSSGPDNVGPETKAADMATDRIVFSYGFWKPPSATNTH